MTITLSDWPRERIEGLSWDKRFSLIREVGVDLIQHRVLLGRCLLGVDRTGSYAEVGCSSALHFGLLELGLEEREIREAMRVARALEDLPLLTEAVEQGALSWGKLRALVRRATRESEGRWLALALQCSVGRLERLLRRDARGEGATREAEQSRICVTLSAEEMGLFQRAVRSLCVQEGRRLSISECLEFLSAEHLSGSAAIDWDRLRDEVRRDLAAQAGVEEEEEEEEEVPWEAVAAQEVEVPHQPDLQLLLRTRVPEWFNPRLAFNPETRLATPAQRQEILRRDGYRCSTPGCPHVLWLQIHHLVFYCEGGATVPANLIVVCSRCHRHIHRGMLRVERLPEGGLCWSDGAGRRLGSGVRGAPETVDFADELARWLDRVVAGSG